MSLSCFMQKRMVLAARLEVDMRAALRFDTMTVVVGRVEGVEGRKCFTAATLSVGQVLHAECKGLFISRGAAPR